jgi:hypothetical protein
MELDELRSAWGSVNAPAKSNEELQLMLKENKHPVLKGIRRQLIIELTCWLAFIACYYTMFDGDRKPIFLNLILIACVMFLVVHNLMGYYFSKYLVNGSSIKLSIQNYLSKVKWYASVSVFARFLYAAGLLLFFTYGIHFSRGKYNLLGVAIAVFAVNLFWLYRLWARRVKQLTTAAGEFD